MVSGRPCCLETPERHKALIKKTNLWKEEEEMQMLGGTHHAAAAGVAGVLQVTVEQLCGSVLEGFG